MLRLHNHSIVVGTNKVMRNPLVACEPGSKRPVLPGRRLLTVKEVLKEHPTWSKNRVQDQLRRYPLEFSRPWNQQSRAA
jgi:hypothetical protein